MTIDHNAPYMDEADRSGAAAGEVARVRAKTARTMSPRVLERSLLVASAAVLVAWAFILGWFVTVALGWLLG